MSTPEISTCQQVRHGSCIRHYNKCQQAAFCRHAVTGSGTDTDSARVDIYCPPKGIIRADIVFIQTRVCHRRFYRPPFMKTALFSRIRDQTDISPYNSCLLANPAIPRRPAPASTIVTGSQRHYWTVHRLP